MYKVIEPSAWCLVSLYMMGQSLEIVQAVALFCADNFGKILYGLSVRRGGLCLMHLRMLRIKFFLFR